jgi:hypothetical protein
MKKNELGIKISSQTPQSHALSYLSSFTTGEIHFLAVKLINICRLFKLKIGGNFGMKTGFNRHHSM